MDSPGHSVLVGTHSCKHVMMKNAGTLSHSYQGKKCRFWISPLMCGCPHHPQKNCGDGALDLNHRSSKIHQCLVDYPGDVVFEVCISMEESSPPKHRKPECQIPLYLFLLLFAGLSPGKGEKLLVHPFSLLKVRMQVDLSSFDRGVTKVLLHNPQVL